MNLTQLKKNLQQLDTSDLQEVIIYLYKKSTDTKDLLALYFNQIDEKDVFANTSERLEKCFRKNGAPAPRSPKIKEAKTIISEYAKLFPLSHKLLELRIDFSFYLAELLSEFGGGDESWENSMCTMFDLCCKQVKEQKLELQYQERLKNICKKLNRNYPEILDGYYAEYFED